MILMDERQSRLWHRMIQLIEEFRQDKVKYYKFVSDLEGALDAGEFLDKRLIDKWCDRWTPLEIARAQQGNDVKAEEVEKYLSDMKSYLESVLE